MLIVGDVICFLPKKWRNLELFCVCPSIDNLLADLYKLPFFKFFLLLKLDFRMDDIKKGLKFGKIQTWGVIVPILNQQLSLLVNIIELDLFFQFWFL